MYTASISNAFSWIHCDIVSVSSQISIVLAICALALTVCVALVSKAELKAARPVALYGLGSGEEQEADNSIVTTFEVF